MRIAKWGNSLVVRLAKALVQNLGLKTRDKVQMVGQGAGRAGRRERHASAASSRTNATAGLGAAERLRLGPNRGEREIAGGEALVNTNLLATPRPRTPKPRRYGRPSLRAAASAYRC